MSRGWMRHAACVGQGELFFPPDSEDMASRDVRESRAKAICWPCPVRLRCRDFGIRTDQRYGIWGGTTEADRAHIRRRHSHWNEYQLSLVTA
jgi:WhiB family redox-sensing transcriptional regulator